MTPSFYDLMEENPVIAAVKDEEGLSLCCALPEIRVIFVLFGDICNLGEMVRRIHAAGKIAMVHLDLISGLSGREVAVDFIKNTTEADGIISTKPALVRHAKALSLYAVLRVFLLDSMVLQNICHQTAAAQPDVVELLPGLMPKIIKKVSGMVSVPVIAGGLISEKEDVVQALQAGAAAVSTTNPHVWQM